MKKKCISKDTFITIYNTCNFFTEKGFEIHNFELRTKNVFISFRTPLNYSNNQEDDETYIIYETTYCGRLDTLEIKLGGIYIVPDDLRDKIREFVDRNQISNRLLETKSISKIRNISKHMDELDDVLTTDLDDRQQLYSVIVRLFTTKNSPSSMSKDFEIYRLMINNR